jgi:ketosteroid isomerase-like protein
MPDNVALLRDAFERFAAERTPVFDVMDPEIEIVNFDSFPVQGPYHGWDGALDWFVDMSEPFDDFRFELADVLAHDSDRVVTTLRITGDSRTHGPHFELVWGAVWTFREGKVVRVEGMRTPEEALEAAGV